MADNPLQAQQDTIRVPVYDVEGFRTDWPVYDQSLVNCFAEVVRNPVTGAGDIVASKRNAIRKTTLDLSAHFTDPTKVIPLANYTVTNLYDVYICAYKDGSFVRFIQYRIQANTSTLLASIASTSDYDKVYFSHGWVDTSDNPTWVVTATWEDGTGASSKGFVIEASGGVLSGATWSQITHANSPWGQTPAKQTRGPLLQLNNQWYIASANGLIHSTGTTSPTSSYVSNSDTVTSGPNYQGWSNAANFISSRFPESYVGLIQYKHHLVALGMTSIQFFTDEGESINPGIPILPTDQALIKFGCLSGKHCINVDDILYWVAYGKDNTVGMWKLEGYTPVKISNKKQDNELMRMAINAPYWKGEYIFTMLIGNKKHIGITGIVGYTLGYAVSSPRYPQTDTYKVTDFCGRHVISMYSLEDKTWWYLNMTFPDDNFVNKILPATNFGNSISPTYDLNAYQHNILLSFDRATAQRSWIHTITEGSYVDSYFRNNTTWDDYGVCTEVQFNGIQVSTEKRKRINKVKIITGSNLKKDSSDTSVNSWILLYSRKNVFDSADYGEVTLRTIPIPNSFYRYYWNNLGMARTATFAIIERTAQATSVKYLEIDLAQGVS